MSARAEFLNDVLITAVEGGIGYWSQVSAYRWSDGEGEPLEVASVIVHEMNDDDDGYKPEGVTVTSADIGRAIGKLMDKNVELSVHRDYRARIFSASMANEAGDLDAGDCDIIMQVAVLGNVVYG